MILDFVEVLSDELDLKEVPSVSSLEESLITSAGTNPSLLADLHEVSIHFCVVHEASLIEQFAK